MDFALEPRLTTAVNPVTSVGAAPSTAPMASRFDVLSPQHITVPSLFNAQLWVSPVET
jgi:hypothetical protein